jgi:hypothetical protein
MTTTQLTQLIRIAVALALVVTCRGADDAEIERKVAAAIHAADGLVTVAEYDLYHLIRDESRNFLGSMTENGGTVRAGHSALKEDIEKTVEKMGEVIGKYAEAALLVRELALLGASEMELVLGFDPIDEDFVKKAAELRSRVAQVRVKLKPLLPPGVTIRESEPGVPF